MKPLKLIGILVSCVALFSCGSSESQIDTTEAVALIEAHELGGNFRACLNELRSRQLRCVNMALETRGSDAVTRKNECDRVSSYLESQNERILRIVGSLMAAPAGLMEQKQLDALGDLIPSAYASRFIAALSCSSPLERDEMVASVMKDWAAAQKNSIAALQKRLVPEHPFGLCGGSQRSEKVDAWMQLSRDERKGRVAAAKMYEDLLEYKEYLRDCVHNLWRIAPYGEDDVFDLGDQRRYLALIQINCLLDDFINLLHREYAPDSSCCFAVYKSKMLPQRKAIQSSDTEEDAFVDNIHRSLLEQFSFDAEENDISAEEAAEVRQKIEKSLEKTMQCMKIAYKAQLNLVRECLSVKGVYEDEEMLLEYYHEKVRAIQSLFLDEVRFIRHFSYWTGQDSAVVNERPEFEWETLSPTYMVPHFLIDSTSAEGLSIVMYRRAGDALRAHVRESFRMMCDEGYSLVIGTAVPDCFADREIQLSYMKACLDDAEYAWEQYAASVGDLIEPPLYRDWGSGTSNMISGYLSILYEHHYLFYSNVINIR